VFLDNDQHLSCFFWQGVCAVLVFPLLIFIWSFVIFSCSFPDIYSRTS
jgi:hypothetical protein